MESAAMTAFLRCQRPDGVCHPAAVEFLTQLSRSPLEAACQRCSKLMVFHVWDITSRRHEPEFLRHGLLQMGAAQTLYKTTVCSTRPKRRTAG